MCWQAQNPHLESPRGGGEEGRDVKEGRGAPGGVRSRELVLGRLGKAEILAWGGGTRGWSLAQG